MISISKSYLRQFGLAALVVALTVVSVVSVASASAAVAITSPSLGNVDVYFDANGNHQDEANEFVGTFPSYPGSGITFSWAPYQFPSGANGAYRVALVQNTTPLGPATWVERKVAHHFAENPSGTSGYVFGPFFSYENICEFCPSIITVQPETYVKEGDDFVYTPLAGALTVGGKPAALTQTEEFVLQALPGKQFKSGGGGGGGGGNSNVCTSPDQSKACCAAAGGSWDGEFGCILPEG